MDNKDLASMTGQQGGEKIVAYKLNEIRMSGDDGKFTYMELLGEKGKDGKYPTKDAGDVVQGIILKMRWRLFRYDELADGSAKITSTSEYDNKNTDKVYVFVTGEKGFAYEIKERLKLGSQRVLYVYLPRRDEIVRMIVKPSALTGDKNPGGELGLFEYVDKFNSENDYLHEYLTKFGSIYREDAKNKRKSYYAMTFSVGDKLDEGMRDKVIEMVKEVHERTTATNFVDEYVPPTDAPKNYDALDEEEDINPEDIPF